MMVLLTVFILLPGTSESETYDADNVVIVFDDSGSMGEYIGQIRKIEAAKIALLEVMKDVPANTNIGLVTFHQGWVYPLGPFDKAKMAVVIGNLRDSGGTPLSKFIKMGADQLLKQRDKQFGNGTYRLLVVTDGESSDGDAYISYTREIMGRGIIFDAIGVAMATEHTLATRVHTYYNANNPKALTAAVKKVFSEVGGKGSDKVTAEAFEIVGSLPDGFAEAAIRGLTKSGNHPIGTTPVNREAGKPAPPKGLDVKVKDQSQQLPPAKTPTAPNPAPSSSGWGCFISALW
jgi:hypothetical protein